MRRDLTSAYAVTAARVISWVIVSGIVFRKLGADALGLLTLVRATVGILSYTSLGLGPAMVKVIAGFGRQLPVPALAVDDDAAARPVLAYAHEVSISTPAERIQSVYSTGQWLAVVFGMVGLVFGILYAEEFDRIHGIKFYEWETARALAGGFVFGVIFRMLSDVPSGLLQGRGLIALDNMLIAAAELIWGILSVAWVVDGGNVAVVGFIFMLTNIGLLILRGFFARSVLLALSKPKISLNWPVAKQLLSLGSLITVAQAADFLYAPVDCILITRFLGAGFVAYYSPAIQIDAGLLLLVTGLAAVLYPRSAVAHAEGNLHRLKAYYFRGTIFSALILLLPAVVIWALSRWIFQIWFHDPMDQTRMILPLILVHTVIGGSSAVGRSILIAMGKARAFTIAVLIAGTSNVILSFIFVKYAHLGLAGIVLGTIVVVVARCAVWMPWYVIRTFKRQVNLGVGPS